jgi:hypothetical protein
MRRTRICALLSMAFLVTLAACQSPQSATPIAPNASTPPTTTIASTPTIEITADATPASRLTITETLNGTPVSQGLMHALIIPSDLSTLYHEHPQELETGRFTLDIPALPTGEYDVWVEITVGSGHSDAILQRATLQLQGASPAIDTSPARVTLEPTNLDIEPSGTLSHLEFLIALDGQPVRRFGHFFGVQVHSFAISTDREWFKHDHAEPLGRGKVDAHFQFPKPGSYVVFLQPSVAGDVESRPMLRHTVTVP